MTSDRSEPETSKTSKSQCGGRNERRHCTRFGLKGEAWFEWEAVDGRRGEGEGFTRNVGRAGTFIETDDAPPVSALLRVIVMLRGRVDDGMEARLCGAGSVRHVVKHGGDAVGFGAEVIFRTDAPSQAG